MVEIVILSENSCHFVNCSASTRVIFFSAWDKSRVKWDNSQNSTQKWGPRAQQSWIVEDMDRLPQTLLSNYNDGCGQSDQKFGSLVVGKGENLLRCVHVRFCYYCYGLCRGSFVSCGSVGMSTVCSWGICQGIVKDCFGCHWSVNHRFLIWLLLCF